MDPGSKQFLLRILSGPHKGAELALAQDQIIIGSGIDADIMLSESVVKEKHIQITLKGGDLSIMALAPDVSVGAKALAQDQSYPLNVFDPVEIGETRMAIGPGEEAWPEELFQEKPAASEEAARSAQADEGGKNDEPIPLTEEVDPPQSFTKRIMMRVQDFSDAQLYRLLGLGSLTAILTVQLIWLIFDHKSEKEEKKVTQLTQEQQVMIELRQRFPSLQVDDLNRSVSAYVDSFGDRQAIQSALQSLGKNYLSRIVTKEQIEQATKDVLVRYRLQYLGVEALEEPGQVALSGYLANVSQREQLVSAIRENLPYVTQVKVQGLKIGSEAVTHVLSILEAFELEDKLYAQVEPSSVKLFGYLSNLQAQQWTSAEAALQEKLDSRFPIESQVTLLPQALFLTWLFGDEIDSINKGKVNWVSLKNGKKFFPGTLLTQEYVLESIEENILTIQKGKTQLRFTL